MPEFERSQGMIWKVLRRLGLLGVGMLTPLVGCHRDISGTYMVSDDHSVVAIELVRTPDQHLTGQFTFSQVKQNGTIDRRSANLVGAIDGENVSISSSGLFGVQSATLSGILDGGTLRIAGPDGEPLILKKSSLDTLQSKLGLLDARSKSLLAAKASEDAARQAEQTQRRLVESIDDLVSHMQRIDTESEAQLGRFPAIEKRYRDITAKVGAYVESERRLSGDPNAAVARSGLDVDASQVALGGIQVHLDVQSIQRDFEMNAGPVAENATNYQNSCRNFDAERGELTQAELAPHNAACSRLLAVLPPFRQKCEALKAGLVHLEQVYVQENDKQQALLKVAEKLK